MKRSWWCRFGLHRWTLGVDVCAGHTIIVAVCSDCGLLEVV